MLACGSTNKHLSYEKIVGYNERLLLETTPGNYDDLLCVLLFVFLSKIFVNFMVIFFNQLW